MISDIDPGSKTYYNHYIKRSNNDSINMLTDRASYVNYLEIQSSKISSLILKSNECSDKIDEVYDIIEAIDKQSSTAVDISNTTKKFHDEFREDCNTKLQVAYENIELYREDCQDKCNKMQNEIERHEEKVENIIFTLMEKISSLEEQLKSNYSSLHNQLINHEEETTKNFVEHSELIHNNNNNLMKLLTTTDETYKNITSDLSNRINILAEEDKALIIETTKNLQIKLEKDVENVKANAIIRETKLNQVIKQHVDTLSSAIATNHHNNLVNTTSLSNELNETRNKLDYDLGSINTKLAVVSDTIQSNYMDIRSEISNCNSRTQHSIEELTLKNSENTTKLQHFTVKMDEISKISQENSSVILNYLQNVKAEQNNSTKRYVNNKSQGTEYDTEEDIVMGTSESVEGENNSPITAVVNDNQLRDILNRFMNIYELDQKAIREKLESLHRGNNHGCHLLTHSPNRLLTYSPNHLLTHSPNHLLTHSPVVDESRSRTAATGYTTTRSSVPSTRKSWQGVSEEKVDTTPHNDSNISSYNPQLTTRFRFISPATSKLKHNYTNKDLWLPTKSVKHNIEYSTQSEAKYVPHNADIETLTTSSTTTSTPPYPVYNSTSNRRYTSSPPRNHLKGAAVKVFI